MVNNWSNIVQACLPRTCLICRAAGPVNTDLGLCDNCLQDLPWIEHACRQCGLPLPAGHIGAGDTQAVCGACLQHAPPFASTIAPLRYVQPVDYLIKQLKFHDNLACAHTLGSLLAHTIRAQALPCPDVIVPVPLHPQRLRQRGYNQAMEIARPLSRLLHVPVDRSSCQRIKLTAAQADLPLAQRQANTRDAFAVRATLRARHVAIIDDVVTSGHTVSALARALLKQNVEQISVWCCARTTQDR